MTGKRIYEMTETEMLREKLKEYEAILHESFALICQMEEATQGKRDSDEVSNKLGNYLNILLTNGIIKKEAADDTGAHVNSEQ